MLYRIFAIVSAVGGIALVVNLVRGDTTLLVLSAILAVSCGGLAYVSWPRNTPNTPGTHDHTFRQRRSLMSQEYQNRREEKESSPGRGLMVFLIVSLAFLVAGAVILVAFATSGASTQPPNVIDRTLGP